MDSNVIKHIIKTVLLILTISFVADKCIFYILNKISDEVYTGQSIGKLNHYLQIKDEVELVVFGSSRANHNIDPIKITKNSFNMGVDGRKLAYCSTLIKLLPKKKKQIILLQVDNEHAFSPRYSGSDIQALSSKYNRSSIIKEEMDALGENNVLQNFYWGLSYNGKALGILKNYLKPNYDYKSYSGYDPIYVNDNQRKIFENILKRDEEGIECDSNFVLNKIYDNYFDELREFCKENNKTLIIFTSPKLNDPCKDDNIAFRKIMENKNLSYYDLTDSFKENIDLKYWKDKEHLSDKGAEVFTEQIKELLSQFTQNN